MSVATAQPTPYIYHHDTLFVLRTQSESHQLVMEMELFSPYFHTKAFPQTFPILQQALPSVLKSLCFNDDKLPFSVEVQNTEIGHLFEHILLAYLCELKEERGVQKITYNGVTKWNWARDKQGTFHITIDVPYSDHDILPLALEKSIQLLTHIMTSTTKTKQTAN